MKNVTVHTGILSIMGREKSSAMGNPRWSVMVDGYVCKTPVDSPLGYSIGKYAEKMVRAKIGTHYGTRKIDEITIIENSYYEQELERALPDIDGIVKIQVKGENCTKWLDLNKESIAALEIFLEKVKKTMK